MSISNQNNALQAITDIDLEDETIRALLPGYLQRRSLEVSKLYRLLDNADFDEIRVIGHNLKGSGGLYGLPQIGVFGTELEVHSASKSQTELAVTIEKLEQYLSAFQL